MARDLRAAEIFLTHAFPFSTQQLSTRNQATRKTLRNSQTRSHVALLHLPQCRATQNVLTCCSWLLVARGNEHDLPSEAGILRCHCAPAILDFFFEALQISSGSFFRLICEHLVLPRGKSGNWHERFYRVMGICLTRAVELRGGQEKPTFGMPAETMVPRPRVWSRWAHRRWFCGDQFVFGSIREF